MNKLKLREIQRFLTEFRLQEGDMSLQRLSTLIEVSLRGEVDQSSLITAARFHRSATSKNIASWTKLTSTKAAGPGYLLSEIDPMNMKTRIIKITERGNQALDLALDRAGLNRED